jgi:hypothetical protein|tara:strand:- start:1390 stop:2040 length:651 start_codon:yes stop_codon:yes gene_type:complete
MATIAASGAYPVAEKRDGGTVVMAGNIADGDPITLAKSNVDFGRIAGEPYGAKINLNDGAGVGTDKQFGIVNAIASSGGTFAYQPTADDPQFLIRGYASKINNSADTTIQIVGSDFGGFGYDGVSDSIKHVHAGSGASTSIDVLAQPSTSIHPERTKGADAGLSYTFAAPSGNGAIASSGDRNALSPLTHPSPLVYMQGSPTPNSDEYKSPETYES